nr:protein toll-like [Dermacentor andersoni]
MQKLQGVYINKLKLEDFNITELQASWFANSFNEIETIDEEYLYGLPELRHVSLSHNSIHMLPPNLFIKTRLLKEVELQVNRISSIEGAFNDLPQLEVLLLSQNNISDTDTIARSTLPNLKELALGQNCIKVITKFSFRKSRIRRVDLSNNAVTDIMPGAFKLLDQLTKLDLKNNSISFLNDSYFAHDSILEHIDISMNRLTTLSKAFNWTRKIEVMKLSFNKILDISDAFSELTELRELYLRGNLISCIQPRTFQGNVHLIHIDLDLNNIRWIAKHAFEGLLSLRRLHLDRNLLVSLNGSVRNLPQLQYLGASFNVISSLEKWEFGNISALTAIYLEGNNISNVEGAFIGVTGLLSLNLGNNQVELLRRSDFALEISGSVAVRDASNIVCARNSNLLVSQKKFVTLGQKDLCPPAIPRGVVYLLLAFGLLAITLALLAAYLRYKQVLKMWLRGRGVCGLAWGVAEDELDADKLFDVFVSFSSNDADWIHEEIIPRLEASGFACCTYERNFKGGFLLQDIIHDAVACSRRTLLVLTQNFLASDWCRLEFRLAHQRALQDNVNRLVIVLVDELVLGALDEDLRLYVRAANYLRWGEPNFWDRLLHSLPTKEAERKLIIEGVPSQLPASGSGDIEMNSFLDATIE